MSAAAVEHLLARRGSGVVLAAGVCGGAPCVAGTRIPVHGLEAYRRLGLTEAQILDAYPTLRAVDLVDAWAYVAAHPEEVERRLREEDADDAGEGQGG